MQMLNLRTERRTQLVDVTAQVQRVVALSAVVSGTCYLYVPHTTAAITINECADADVARDVEDALDRLVPTAAVNVRGQGNAEGRLGFWRGLGRCVLEFLGDEEDWDLRASAVLPDEVYVLQFSYRGGGQ
jgi:hypothetical protein